MFFARRLLSKPRRGSVPKEAFSLIELTAALGVIATLVTLVTPALLPMKGAMEMTRAAYEVADVLENARAYATANNTYVWVGFYEEDASQGSAIPGAGRIIISMVASRDGTTIYDPSGVASPATPIDPGRLIQIHKLVKIENMHLKTASAASEAVFPRGSGTGDAFKTRPSVSGATAQIGDSSPSASLTPFQYPVGSGDRAAQYLFGKVIQFSPRGEARVNNTNYSLKPVVEIGLQPARGNVVDATNRNVAAVQVTGLLGQVKVYQP